MAELRSSPERLGRERNVFAVCAVCCLAALGLGVPRALKMHRERKQVDSQLVDLQSAIVRHQERTREIQRRIVETQEEIGKRRAP